ncbi:MAG: hypothetical protein ACFE8M_11990 [Candidatus Hermodarchaeota archaeon]
MSEVPCWTDREMRIAEMPDLRHHELLLAIIVSRRSSPHDGGCLCGVFCRENIIT